MLVYSNFIVAPYYNSLLEKLHKGPWMVLGCFIFMFNSWNDLELFFSPLDTYLVILALEPLK